MSELLDSLESSSDTVVYAMDESGITTESDNRYSWSPVGAPPILEKNGSHEGINLVGSTCILNNFHTVTDVYSKNETITSAKIIIHFDYLIELNPGKTVVVILDNAKTHTSAAIEQYYITKKNVLKFIFLPKYSPDMNPQENMWNHLKAKLYRPSARSNIEELIIDTKAIIDELNLDSDKICSLTNARHYLT
jgi:transposase